MPHTQGLVHMLPLLFSECHCPLAGWEHAQHCAVIYGVGHSLTCVQFSMCVERQHMGQLFHFWQDSPVFASVQFGRVFPAFFLVQNCQHSKKNFN